MPEEFTNTTSSTAPRPTAASDVPAEAPSLAPPAGSSRPDDRPDAAAAVRGELWRKLGPAGMLGVLWATAPALCGFALLANIKPLVDWLNQSPTLGLAGYVAVFIVSAGLGFLPTYAQSILGGWVFGFALGFPAALVGFAGGSLIGYFISRGVSQQRVQDVIDARPKWRAVREALIGQGFWRTFLIVSLVRLPPNSPFAVTNLLLSTTGVKLLPYTLGTIVGMAPRTGLAVFLAAAAASTGAQDIQSFVKASKGNLWLLIGGLVVFFVVLGIIGFLANKAIAKVTAPTAAPPH